MFRRTASRSAGSIWGRCSGSAADPDLTRVVGEQDQRGSGHLAELPANAVLRIERDREGRVRATRRPRRDRRVGGEGELRRVDADDAHAVTRVGLVPRLGVRERAQAARIGVGPEHEHDRPAAERVGAERRAVDPAGGVTRAAAAGRPAWSRPRARPPRIARRSTRAYHVAPTAAISATIPIPQTICGRESTAGEYSGFLLDSRPAWIHAARSRGAGRLPTAPRTAPRLTRPKGVPSC